MGYNKKKNIFVCKNSIYILIPKYIKIFDGIINEIKCNVYTSYTYMRIYCFNK